MPEIETHPFQPFLPANAQLLMLGTFPPSSKRWCMPFYYPNYQNDMWRIFGYHFFGDKQHFVLSAEKRFDQDAIISFLNEKGIALYDTAYRIIRTKNTASDKDLQVVEPSNLDGMLHTLVYCRAVITAGQLATDIFSNHFGIDSPAVGTYSQFVFEDRTIRLYRMPSSSRAYPVAIEKKAIYYKEVFDYLKL